MGLGAWGTGVKGDFSLLVTSYCANRVNILFKIINTIQLKERYRQNSQKQYLSKKTTLSVYRTRKILTITGYTAERMSRSIPGAGAPAAALPHLRHGQITATAYPATKPNPKS